MTERRPAVDELADLCRDAAIREFKDLLNDIHPRDLTAVDALALVAVLRPVAERVRAQQHPPAVLNVVPRTRSKVGRVKAGTESC
jgi:hypothetical protein